MKYLIVSDIHGSSDSTKFIVDLFNNEGFDYILCLGDVLYHGPRNDLPSNYAPKEVIALLNPISDKVYCVKGNCEAEVDQMVLNFKIHDYLDLDLNGIDAHLEHGHHLDLYKGNAKLVLSGHTHIPVINKNNDQVFVNPGSITIPKNGSKRGYATLIDNKLTLLSMDNDVVNEIIL